MAGRKSAEITLESLSQLTVAALRKLAKENRLIGYSQLRKAALVERLHRHLGGLDADRDASRRQTLEALDRALHPAAPDAPSSPVAEEPVPAPERSSGDPGAMRDASWYAPPLPEGYGFDRLTLMVRDPHWLYCYWELRPERLAEVRAELDGQSWPVLRVNLLGEGDEVLDGWEYGVGEDARSWYVHTGRPGARFRAELGLRDNAGRYRLLVASNTVSAPMDAPSERWDEEWVGLSRESWERLGRRERPFPGSLGGWDSYRIEISQVAARRLGASEQFSAAAPGARRREDA